MVPNSSVIEQVKKKHNCDSRINNLPDELLGQILSLLPTKDAVATSVLSKRWKSMYTLITQLDFDDSPISFCQNHPHLIEHWPSFRKFVDHVLSKFQSGNIITRFRLKFGKPAESNHHPPFDGDYCPEMCYPVLHPTPLGKWMCFPLTRGVRELDLCTRSRKPGYLPFALFRCQTLEVLKLQVNHHLRLPKSFHLPNLRVFHLTIDRVLFGNFIARLLSKCPLLEDLAVVGDWGNDNHPIEIVSAPSLRRLVITNRGDEDTQRSTFVVDAPFLEYLRYSDFLAFQYSVGTLNALVEAQIYILCCLQTEESTYEVILDLIRPLSNVRHLTLCEDTVEGLEGSRLEGNNNNNKLPIFHNLKHLKLGFGYSQGHKVMLELLRVAPFLETLEFWSLKMYGHYGSENSEGLMREIAVEIENWSTSETITIPSCLEFHLKKIVVLDVFTGTELEVAVIQYFLRHGLVLEEVDIRCAECSVPIADWILLDRKIQNLPRRSTACSIKLRR